MSTISRRAFLKTVGVGALSVAAMSVLAGCDGTTQQPVVDNSIGTISATSGMTYVVGDYAVAADFSSDVIGNLYSALTNAVPQAQEAVLNRTMKGYVSNSMIWLL